MAGEVSGESGVNRRWRREEEYIEGSAAVASSHHPKEFRGPAIGTDIAHPPARSRYSPHMIGAGSL